MKSVRREDGVPSRPEFGQSRILVRAYLAVAALLSVYAWAVFVLSFRHDGLIGPRYNAPGTDFMVYHTAARLFRQGGIPLLTQGAAFTARLNRDFAGWLTSPLPPHPWVYPPPFLLLLVPFGRLPFAIAYPGFLAATFAAAVAGAWCVAAGGVRRVAWIGVLALAPATAIDAVVGQNALLTAGILLGGFGLLRRSPLAGGAVLGAMSYKPQFAMMVPVALIALGQWRALAAAAAGAALLAVLSLALLGTAIWRDWLAWLFAGGDDYATWLEWGRSWGVGVSACAAWLGLPPPAAQALQVLAAIGAAGAVYSAFRRPLVDERRLVVLLGGTVLAAPHVLSYDLVLLAAAAALLFRHVAATPSAFAPPLLLLLWAAPLLGPPRASPAGFAVPLLAAALVAYALSANGGLAVPAVEPVASEAGGA